MLSRSFFCFAMLLLAPAAALADVVDDHEPRRDCPPTSCPPGTNPYAGGHGSCSPGCSPGPFCTPDGGQCAATDTCEERSYCIERVHLGNSAIDVIRGSCAGGAACDRGECDVSSRCVHQPAPAVPADPPSGESDGFCAASGGTRGALGPWLLLGLPWLLRRR